ncbi:MAG: hypothetical protein ABJF88_10250 [Rhodothermales bacterium]
MSADRLRPFPALVLLAALLAAGCSDAFDPFVEAEPAFALYGFLDARRDTQFVRVQPVTDLDTNRVTARVTSTALGTGERIAWRDSLVLLDDGTLGTVFYAPFRPEPGVRYRVEAALPGVPGVGSAAEITVPAEADLRVPAPSVVDGIVTQGLVLEGDLRPRDVRVTYTVQRVSGGEPVPFSFEYVSRSVPSAGGFEVVVNLLRDARAIRTVLGVEPGDGQSVALVDLQLNYDLVDERGGVVSSGLGAFGAAACFETGWTLAPAAVEAIGFVDAQGGA